MWHATPRSFTFLKATGSEPDALERITIIPISEATVTRDLARAGPSVGISATLASLAAFDARSADCFKEADRERLLGVIEAGFSDFDEFNALVRRAIWARLPDEDAAAYWEAMSSKRQKPTRGRKRTSVRLELGQRVRRLSHQLVGAVQLQPVERNRASTA